MTLQPLVSIVTPVYNEERYLAECIESVIAQTYQNWDYTIIDNCSTDSTLSIANAYAAKDSRIRIHRNQQFVGAIANHNIAVRLISANSKYCKVVLGDDRIYPECLAKMVRLAEENPPVGVVGALVQEGGEVKLKGLNTDESVFSGQEVCRRHLLEAVYTFGSANSVLYRSDLVRSREPFYNETNIHADTEVCFALLQCSDFGFLHEVLTFTRVRSGSLSTASHVLQTDHGSMLQLLMVYGPKCLTREECDAGIASHLAEYYRFLAKNLMLRWDWQLLQYHRQQIGNAGVTFSVLQLAWGALQTIGYAALHPLYSAKRVWLRWQEEPAGNRVREIGGTPAAAKDS